MLLNCILKEFACRQQKAKGFMYEKTNFYRRGTGNRYTVYR